MQQSEAASPNLSNYIQFFKIIGELESQRSITGAEKKWVKKRFTMQDPKLMRIVIDEDTSHTKDNLITYLRSSNNGIPLLNRRNKSNTQDYSPTRVQTQNVIVCYNQNKEQAQSYIAGLTKHLQTILNTEELVDEHFLGSVNELHQLLEIVNHKYALISDDIDEEVHKLELIEMMREEYKILKERYSKYMNSLLVLMDENVSPKNIQDLLHSLLEQLLGCKHFSYLTFKDLKMHIYKSNQDKYQQFELPKPFLDYLVELPDKQLIKFKLEQDYVDAGEDSYIIKISDLQYFVLHVQDSTLERIAAISDHQFVETIQEFCIFIIHTTQQIRVQYFSTIQIGDNVLEIGLELVRCSKYLLVDSFIKLLRKKYNLIKIDYIDLKSDQFQDRNKQIIRFKDQIPIMYQVDFNLGKKADLKVYNITHQLYQRYSQFIKQCYDKTTFYKYFLRSKNILMIDFDKLGELRFLSKPISNKVKQQYQLSYEGNVPTKTNYKQLFNQNLHMLLKIENYISESKKWQLKDIDHDSYEIFIKKEENSFKGFTIIVSEQEWSRKKTEKANSELKKSLRQQILQSETMDYIKKVEEYYPDIRNSVVSMYMPQKEQEISHQQSVNNKTPTLVFRKIDKESVIGKTSFFFKQREEEKKQAKFNPNLFSALHMVSKDTDSIIDSFDFNILVIQTQVEKSRIAWSILERNNFIQTFCLPNDKLANFLNELEQQYNQHNNPFHNYDHGVQVMQASHYLIQQLMTSHGPQLLNNQTRFCLILSALCHDVAHTGKTNVYEANSLSTLAIRYHDKVILEQHHAATAIKILREKETNILCNFTDSDFKGFRKQMISNILATDMQEHFKMLKEFEARQQTYGQDPEDLQLLCGIITHAADFNGSGRKWPASKHWSDRINREYRAQYEEEGRKGYPQQPFMKDLDKVSNYLYKINVMAKNEMGFFRVIVRPVFVQINTFSKGSLQTCVENLDESIAEWEKILQENQG